MVPIWPIYSQVSLWCSFSRCCLIGNWEPIRKSWAPAKCRFFLWFVAHNHCWTADRLAQQGLNHREVCPLCDEEHKTIQHVLVSSFCLPNLVLHTESGPHHPFSTKGEFIWWQAAQSWFSCVYPKKKAAPAVSGPTQQGLNSLIILGAWILWKHRDACVFNVQQASPRPSTLPVRRPSSGMAGRWPSSDSGITYGLNIVREGEGRGHSKLDISFRGWILWQQPGLQGQPGITVNSSSWVYRNPWKRDGCCESLWRR